MLERQPERDDTTPDRCLRVWLALILQARLRQTITYECLACVVGVPAMPLQGNHGILSRIRRHCERNRAPLLDVLIVGTTSGRPSEKRWPDWNEAEIVDMMNQVFDHDWAGTAIPNARDFL